MANDIRQLNSVDKLLFGSLLSIFFIIGYQYLIKQACGVFHDDGIYVSTAKALAEGKGYRLINLPGSPPQTKYPILYPMLLALIWKICPNYPQNIFFMKLLSLAIGALAMGVSYLFLIRFNYCSRHVAFISCLICATAPSFLFFATNTLSEVPFLLLFLLSLWALEHYSRHPSQNWLHTFFTGILLGLPFLCRSIGFVFIISAIVFCYRKSIQIRWIILGSITVISPWLIWVAYSLSTSNYDPIKGYYLDYLGCWAKYGLSSILSIFSMNFLLVLIGISRFTVEGFFSIFFGGNREIAGIILCFFIASIFLFNYWKEFREGNLVSWVLLLYFIIIFMWPWPPGRFLAPILPFLIIGLMLGAKRIFQGFASHRFYRPLNVSLVAFFIISNLFILHQHIVIQNRTGYPELLSKNVAVQWVSYENIFKWVRQYASPDDIIASGLDSMVFLYTGRQSFRPFLANSASLFYDGRSPALGTAKEFRDILQTYKPKYLIHTPMPGFSEERHFGTLMHDFLGQYPNALRPVYIGEDARFKVYEVNYFSHFWQISKFYPKEVEGEF